MMKYTVNNLIELNAATKAIHAFLLQGGVPLELAFDSRLIVSELAGNVLKHARSVARVEVRIENGRIELTVHAENGALPPERSACSSVTAEGGRGLFLVDKLSARRFLTEDGGVRVWIEL